MKQTYFKARRRRESGAALITALMVSVCTAMLLAASLTVALTSTTLGWTQSYAESALQLADAGVNSELQYIAANAGNSNVLLKSSQPTVSAGVTVSLPGLTSYVLGRVGTVTGYSGGNYYVYSSNNASGTVAWDGATTPFYITSSACVNGCWQTVQIQSTTASLFNVYGIFSIASYPSSSTGVTLGSSASVTITGAAGINGTVTTGSGASLTAPTCINGNCGAHSSGQFGSGNLCSGGHLCSVTPPYIYPKTSDCCRSCFGCPAGTSDATAFSTCKSQSCNSSCVYQYKGNASSATLSPSNCTTYSGCGNGCLNNSCFKNANTCPGTYTSDYWYWFENPTVAVQTLIFEPGDYYFTGIQLQYAASCQMIIDPQAQASGGTPGQVRFWCYDPNSSTDGNPADYCQLPITNTCASGSSTPDPGQFRIYYAKDGCSLTFTRPQNITDWTGTTITGNFNYYCGVYASTKVPNDTSSSVGTCVGFTGTTSSQNWQSSNVGGSCCLNGSILCDKMNFNGPCQCNYTPSQTCTKDPCSGATCTGWTCSGG